MKNWKQRELLFKGYVPKENWIYQNERDKAATWPENSDEYFCINEYETTVYTEIEGLVYGYEQDGEQIFTVQDTGKDDCNKKRIFEADIVEFLHVETLPLPNSELEHIDHWYTGVIIMNNSTIWCIKREGYDYYLLHEQDSDNCEIKGN